LFIYESGWDTLTKRAEQSKNKQIEVVKLPLPIPAKLSKEILEKLKFFNKRGKKANEPEKPKKSYAQASALSIGEILKLKKNFLSLFAKKIENIYRMINDSGKSKPKINITTKGSLKKQIIIPINNNNKTKLLLLQVYISLTLILCSRISRTISWQTLLEQINMVLSLLL